jgi:CBS domain-containing protein
MRLPKLADIATAKVVTIDACESIQSAIHLMMSKNLRDVIVTGHEALRILTSREVIALRLKNVSFEQSLSSLTLNPVPTLSHRANVLEALDVIRRHNDDHICITDHNNRLSGIVSYTDLAMCCTPLSMPELAATNLCQTCFNYWKKPTRQRPLCTSTNTRWD